MQPPSPRTRTPNLYTIAPQRNSSNSSQGIHHEKSETTDRPLGNPLGPPKLPVHSRRQRHGHLDHGGQTSPDGDEIKVTMISDDPNFPAHEVTLKRSK